MHGQQHAQRRQAEEILLAVQANALALGQQDEQQSQRGKENAPQGDDQGRQRQKLSENAGKRAEERPQVQINQALFIWIHVVLLSFWACKRLLRLGLRRQ